MPWPVHPNGLLGAQGDNDTYRIERSLRLNSADSAYLNRTPASAGNRNTWTWSGWVKRAKLGTSQVLFQAGTASSPYETGITFPSGGGETDTLRVDINGNSAGIGGKVVTSALFRDTSAWYHIVLRVDLTESISTDRVKIYVNGVLQTSTATNPSNFNTTNSTQVNNNVAHAIGSNSFATGNLADYYLTEINFIDGQALTPSSFGETDAITGRWKAKAYSGGNYGTNGFYLKFADNSGTTATTLGKDSSGNGNNWTPNNFSVTDGAGNDSLLDSPTNSGTSGNYCTLNPVHLAGTTISNGNLSATCPTGTTYYFARGSFGIPQTGKWYWETTITTVGQYPVVGVVAATNQEISASDSYAGKTTNSAGWFGGIDAIYANGSTIVSGLSAISNGDVIMCAVSDNKVYLGRNGTWANSGDPVAGTGSVLTATADLVPAITLRGTTAPVVDLNFGQRPFAYTAPTGFKALCTTNLNKDTAITTSGSFTGNASADGPFVWLNGTPTAMTINGNAVTFQTHVDKLANGFKVRTSSASYNASGSNTFSVSTTERKFKYARAQAN